jgi:hypothetical protein
MATLMRFIKTRQEGDALNARALESVRKYGVVCCSVSAVTAGVLGIQLNAVSFITSCLEWGPLGGHCHNTLPVEASTHDKKGVVVACQALKN